MVSGENANNKKRGPPKGGGGLEARGEVRETGHRRVIPNKKRNVRIKRDALKGEPKYNQEGRTGSSSRGAA